MLGAFLEDRMARWLGAIVLACMVSFAVAENVESTYRLGAGDLVKIKVYGEEDLSMEVRLGDSGAFSYPFLGELRVAGDTVNQVEAKISRGLKGDYLVDPSVSVSVLEYRPFYVNGEVEEPGSYPYVPGMTVRKAITIAGGFTERASRSKIFVDPEADATDRHVVELNDKIKPGDTITIEESFF